MTDEMVKIIHISEQTDIWRAEVEAIAEQAAVLLKKARRRRQKIERSDRENKQHLLNEYYDQIVRLEWLVALPDVER